MLSLPPSQSESSPPRILSHSTHDQDLEIRAIGREIEKMLVTLVRKHQSESDSPQSDPFQPCRDIARRSRLAARAYRDTLAAAVEMDVDSDPDESGDYVVVEGEGGKQSYIVID